MKHILSIQSHVAYGHVGNAAAVFPLQRLGHEVFPVHTVQFSNHTGYGAWTGDVFAPEHIAAVLDGMEARGVLAACDAVLSGYMGDAALGRIIVEAVGRVRRYRPEALYCCDPVMGDVGRGFFVRPGILEFMKAVAVPAADIITPNQFELAHLTGRAIVTLDDAVAAAADARRLGPRIVLVTSLLRAGADPGTIEMLVDSAEGTWRVATPRLDFPVEPNGAGDCVAALFLARLLEGGDPPAALQQAAASVFAIFAATARAGTRELQIIAAQDEIVRPRRTFPVEALR